MPANKVFEYISEQNINAPKEEFERFSYSFHSLDKKEGDNYLFEFKISGAVIREKGLSKAILHSDSLQNIDLSHSQCLPILALLNKPLLLQITPKGNLVSIKGAKETLESTFKKWEIKEQFSAASITDCINTLNRNIQGLFFKFPALPLKPSMVWTEESQNMTYTVDKVKDDIYYISGINTEDKDFNVKASYQLEYPSGLIRTYLLHSNTNKGTPIDITQSINISNVISNKNIDTNWINMAVKLSHWSKSLRKTENEFDSVKVMVAFKEYDKIYTSNKHFQVQKLGIIQQIGNYELYHDLLIKTPTEYIKNEPSHLHNKLQQVVDSDANEAYQVSKYLNKAYPTSFNGWIQNSFAQNFIISYNFKGRDKIERTSYSLLTTFRKDKTIYKSIAPLDLWVSAKKNPDNIPLLLQVAKKLGTMNVTSGNAGRYSLLTCQMLFKKNKKTEADILLAKTTEKLYQATIDTLNDLRFTHQNLLAYAYYLKYQQEEKKDSVKAIKYLALAAKFSPKNNKEKAHNSFYDRVFLKSKENYREDYLNKILASKDDELFLSLIEEDINTNPSNLAAMQSLFTKRFADKSFSSFFVNQVVGNWPKAPIFALQYDDNTLYNSESFKNKWTVLDFWGTWCSPCREEMPLVNKFYEESKLGKHGNINFLSIACHDSKIAVDGYLKTNNFTIPVALSDGIVQRNYKIDGYPSKILISPSGKMINIEFGKDWLAVLKTFQSISE